jgi:nucleotide-binding universal stress UspA family protein
MRVLLCADGLAETMSATSWLERMSPAEPSALCVAAVARLKPLALGSSAALALVRELIVDRSRRVGEAAAACLADRWRDLTVRVIEGEPHEQLLRAATEWRAELVVVGLEADGDRGPSAGDVARVAAHHLECSVLLAAATAESIHDVVLGMDGSPSAREAVRLLSLFGLAHRPRVLALGVVDTSWRRALDIEELPGAAREALASAEARQAADVQGTLARRTAGLAGRALVDTQVVAGSPGEVIRAAALERRAGLIAIGHQGLAPVRRLTLGSVAAQLLAAPPCSLLIGRK